MLLFKYYFQFYSSSSAGNQHQSVHVIGFHNNNENPGGSSDKNSNVVLVSPIHYATPKATSVKVQMVPDFHLGKHDMGKALM